LSLKSLKTIEKNSILSIILYVHHTFCATDYRWQTTFHHYD